jgi:hypothetical protein
MVVQPVKHVLYAQKVKYLKYGTGTDHPDWCFSYFSSFPPGKYLDITASFHISYSSPYTK